MPKPYFQFKQFTIWHDKCAMKVNTDGILLGAWTDISDDKTIVDVGTGSGLVSVMLAQRCVKNGLTTHVTGVEIDSNAAIQAADNFAISPWGEQLDCLEADILTQKFEHKFDHVVSNPPYFSMSLENEDPIKSAARHQTSLNTQSLLKKAYEVSTGAAKLTLILPTDEMQKVMRFCQSIGWYPKRVLNVRHSDSQNKVIRQLVEFRKVSSLELQESNLSVRDEIGKYSVSYKTLCKDFYLRF